MKAINKLLKNNAKWAEEIVKDQPDFFKNLAQNQTPDYLWIGCSDSRVPAEQVTQLLPGELFVHRNIANMVIHTDLSCASVIQFAVEVLKVKHIIVCGHYGCGGVKASMDDQEYGLIENWLSHIKDVTRLNQKALANVSGKEHFDLLCDLNVMEQVKNVCNTSTVRNAWRNKVKLTVHGWIYNLEVGKLKSLATRTS